eukprot:SAG11_NODE_1628_length_4547_cov_24.204178_5_plen_85_part_00
MAEVRAAMGGGDLPPELLSLAEVISDAGLGGAGGGVGSGAAQPSALMSIAELEAEKMDAFAVLANQRERLGLAAAATSSGHNEL